MQVEIWSDVVCPWCYIGKRRLEDAVSRFAHAGEIEVVWRSFELDPNAPTSGSVDLVGRLAAKYGVTREQAEAMNERVSRIADDEGLDFRLDIARPGRTFDAHRLIHLGGERGAQDAVKEGLLAAYQTEGRPIADPEVLLDVAIAAGLDEGDVRDVLAGDRYADDVRREEREASELGITSVPFFVLDRRSAVSGAQSSDVLLGALEQAWDRRSLIAVPGPAAGEPEHEICGPDRCEVPRR